MPNAVIYHKTKQKYIDAANAWIAGNRSRHNATVRRSYAKAVRAGRKFGMIPRKKLLAIIGMECISCGYDKNTLALQLDHKKGDGKIDRQRFNSNTTMYRYYLKNEKEAKEKLQTMCANCNMIKRFENQELNNKYDGLLE